MKFLDFGCLPRLSDDIIAIANTIANNANIKSTITRLTMDTNLVFPQMAAFHFMITKYLEVEEPIHHGCPKIASDKLPVFADDSNQNSVIENFTRLITSNYNGQGAEGQDAASIRKERLSKLGIKPIYARLSDMCPKRECSSAKNREFTKFICSGLSSINELYGIENKSLLRELFLLVQGRGFGTSDHIHKLCQRLIILIGYPKDQDSEAFISRVFSFAFWCFCHDEELVVKWRVAAAFYVAHTMIQYKDAWSDNHNQNYVSGTIVAPKINVVENSLTRNKIARWWNTSLKETELSRQERKIFEDSRPFGKFFADRLLSNKELVLVSLRKERLIEFGQKVLLIEESEFKTRMNKQDVISLLLRTTEQLEL